MGKELKSKDRLVWAKMRSHPIWPARVTKTPQGFEKHAKNKTCVLFFGTENYGFLKESMLVDYEEHREKFETAYKRSDFLNAVQKTKEFINHLNIAEINTTERSTESAQKIHDVVRIKTEPDSDDDDNDETNDEKVDEKAKNNQLVSELMQMRSKYNKTYYELQKQSEKVHLLESENSSLVKRIGHLTEQNRELVSTKDALTDETKNIGQKMQDQSKTISHLKAKLHQFQAGFNQSLNETHDEVKKGSSRSSENEDDGNFEVEKILDHRIKRKKREFLIHWANYDNSHDTWIMEKNLSCPDILKEYLNSKNMS